MAWFILIMASAWICLRVFVHRQFLIWDWADGKFGYVWRKHYWRL